MGATIILDARGQPVTAIQSIALTADDHDLLLAYKKRILEKYGLAEALYCRSCWDRDLSDGCEAHVLPTRSLIKCRCTVRTYVGA